MEPIAVLSLCLLFIILLLYGITYLFPSIFGDNAEQMAYLTATLQSLEKKKSQFTYPRITVEEFKKRTSIENKNRESLSVCFGHVINLKGFIETHPGGNFLDHFIGRDMTPWMIITHVKSESALKTLRSRTIGLLINDKSEKENQTNFPYFNTSLLPNIDKDFVKLFFELNEKKIFVTYYSWTFRDIVEVYLPLLIGYIIVLLLPSYFYVGIFIMGISGARQGIFYHDIMHRSVFTCAKRARDVVCYSSFLIWGFDFNTIGDIHDIHHGFVNIIGLDTAIDMPCLPVDPKHFDISKLGFPLFARKYFFAANTFFYGFLVWMVLPFYSLYPFFVNYLTKKGFFPKGLFAILRICIIAYFWYYQSPFVYGAILGFFYFATVGSLNHFHKEMTTIDKFFPNSSENSKPHHGDINTFVALQSQTVQNTDHGPIIDALLGHFTLHIEHHLFPMMPRRAYPIASPFIQDLLKKYNLNYSVCSQSDALAAFNNTLRYPESKIKTRP